MKKYILINFALILLLVTMSNLVKASCMVISGLQTYMVEEASTDAQMEKGLSNRRSVNGGMIFFPKKGKIPVWMKDTYVDLTIIFLEKNKVNEVINLEKLSTQIHFSKSDNIDSMIEMPQGSSNIAEGDKLIINCDN